MTLHFRQMGLTDARTFMDSSGKRQDIRSVGRYRNGLLEVSREPSVARRSRPAVLTDVHLGPALVHHGLDREDEPLLEADAPGPGAVVRHLRILVELAADAVPDELPHEGVACLLGHVLDR